MKKKEKNQIQLDDWQQQVLDQEGDICVCAGRQTGKSTVISIKAAKYMVENPGKEVLIVSTTEDQSQLMIVKILDYLLTHYPTWVCKGTKRPTKHQIQLTNGSTVRCKAVGVGGVSIRGFTIDMLIADEAAFMPEDVWAAITPMLLTTGGSLILISTPFGRQGFFYESYHDEKFHTYHVNSVEVMTNRPTNKAWTKLHRENATARLKKEQERMTEKQFAQEYLGEFVDDIAQFFKDELIAKTMHLERLDTIARGRDYFLGVDIARMGEDESTFEVIERREDSLYHRENLITTKQLLTQTADHIKRMDSTWNFQKIYLDDEGIGIGVFDMLITNDQTKRKTEALRNSQKVIDYKRDRKQKMLKVDLYMNLLRLMEQGKIHLLKDDNIFQSLKSVQYEYTVDKKGQPYLKIFGNYTHIVEGLIRAAWSIKEKGLNIWVTSV